MPTERQGAYNVLPRYVYATALHVMWLFSHPIYMYTYIYIYQKVSFLRIFCAIFNSI
jgi:hypothetical protein